MVGAGTTGPPADDGPDCIVSSVPAKVRKCTGPPELLRSEISFSRTCNIPKQWNSRQTRSNLNEMCFVRSLIRLYIYYIIHKVYNSLKITMLTKTNICSV